MKLNSTVIALVLLAFVSSAAFAAQPPTVPQSSQILLAQIFTPSTNPAATPAGTPVPAALSPICTPCTQAQCTRICHQPAVCSFDPDTGCSFCSCF